jgi:dihydropyrimidine dehydrogenase (NAD+) subunit PreT
VLRGQSAAMGVSHRIRPHVFDELVPPLTEAGAVVEADRCLECGGAHAAAPCAVACPAEIDVPRFISAIADGDPAEAAAVIWDANLLGATCARVCPVEELCVGACVTHRDAEGPIAIGRLQRFATDWALDRGYPLRGHTHEQAGGKVAVVGAGPAGLVCAGELSALGHDVTVYDDRAEAGGLVRYAIAPYRQNNEPLPDELRGLRELGVSFEFEHPVDRWELRKLVRTHDAVFLGVGMGADLPARLPGEQLPGVWPSLPFIEALKTGSPAHVGARVAVIGGGNTAVDVAIEAKRLGADEVTMLYRRTEAEMPAYAHEIELAREEGVEIRFLTIPVRFVGTTYVEGIECREARLGEPDDSGRRRPETIPGSEFVLPVDTAILAIGQLPHGELLESIEGLEVDRGLVVDESGRTGNPKVFAGGDAVNGGATVVEAVRGAKRAASAIDELIRSAP